MNLKRYVKKHSFYSQFWEIMIFKNNSLTSLCVVVGWWLTPTSYIQLNGAGSTNYVNNSGSPAMYFILIGPHR